MHPLHPPAMQLIVFCLQSMACVNIAQIIHWCKQVNGMGRRQVVARVHLHTSGNLEMMTAMTDLKALRWDKVRICNARVVRTLDYLLSKAFWTWHVTCLYLHKKTYKYFSVIWLLCNCGYEMIICETFLEFSMFTSVGRTATHLMKYSDQNNKTSEQLTQSVCCCHVIVRGHHPCILVQ